MQWISSVKIAVTCLSFLFVLTFWGTIAQVDIGLFQAQEKIFYVLVFSCLRFHSISRRAAPFVDSIY